MIEERYRSSANGWESLLLYKETRPIVISKNKLDSWGDKDLDILTYMDLQQYDKIRIQFLQKGPYKNISLYRCVTLLFVSSPVLL